jgi:hypothetical protein
MNHLKGAQALDIGLQDFTKIRPVSVGYLEARTKISKFLSFRPENCRFVLFSTAAELAKKLLSPTSL